MVVRSIFSLLRLGITMYVLVDIMYVPETKLLGRSLLILILSYKFLYL